MRFKNVGEMPGFAKIKRFPNSRQRANIRWPSIGVAAETAASISHLRSRTLQRIVKTPRFVLIMNANA